MLPVIAGAVVLLVGVLGATLAFTSGDSGTKTRTMPGGQTMTGQMHEMDDGSVMTGETMTMP